MGYLGFSFRNSSLPFILDVCMFLLFLEATWKKDGVSGQKMLQILIEWSFRKPHYFFSISEC